MNKIFTKETQQMKPKQLDEKEEVTDKEVLEASQKLLEANRDAYKRLSKAYECDETKNQKIKELEELVASGEINEVAAKELRLAILNTKHNKEGKVVISIDDEWRNETEWDEVFQQLLKEREYDK